MTNGNMEYVDWFDVASKVREFAAETGKRFLDGVERAAALAALNEHDFEYGGQDARRAIKKTFEAMRISSNSRWDGSIA